MSRRFDEIVRRIPALPDQLPERRRGRERPVDVVQKYVDKRYNNDADFRALVGSNGSADSPSGSTRIDDVKAMIQIKADAADDGVVRDAWKDLKWFNAVKAALYRYGPEFSRRLRIANAKQITHQPAE